MDTLEMEDITSESLPGDAQLTPSDGQEAVNPNTLTLNELNQFLGKDFKDKETALKSIKETTRYVGKVGQLEKKVAELENAPRGEFASAQDVKMLKDELFFSKNPDYAAYRNVIAKMGDNPADVVASDEFKMIFEKAKGYDEVQQTRTVLQSNPRIAQASSKVDEARAAMLRGDTDAARELAGRAVLEAYEDK